jgi:hypothetical protein
MNRFKGDDEINMGLREEEATVLEGVGGLAQSKVSHRNWAAKEKARDVPDRLVLEGCCLDACHSRPSVTAQTTYAYLALRRIKLLSSAGLYI